MPGPTIFFRREEIKKEAKALSRIKIPKEGDFKTLAICREHKQGYDILHAIDVRVD